ASPAAKPTPFYTLYRTLLKDLRRAVLAHFAENVALATFNTHRAYLLAFFEFLMREETIARNLRSTELPGKRLNPRNLKSLKGSANFIKCPT
ncbi:MAG: hypothetical protein ACUVTO_02280, partial [Candidatus Caldatribacteriaceae bacterium]